MTFLATSETAGARADGLVHVRGLPRRGGAHALLLRRTRDVRVRARRPASVRSRPSSRTARRRRAPMIRPRRSPSTGSRSPTSARRAAASTSRPTIQARPTARAPARRRSSVLRPRTSMAAASSPAHPLRQLRVLLGRILRRRAASCSTIPDQVASDGSGSARIGPSRFHMTPRPPKLSYASTCSSASIDPPQLPRASNSTKPALCRTGSRPR